LLAEPLLRPGVTACIAAHPGRFSNGKLNRALQSVTAQTRQPDAVIVSNDRGGRSAAWNRQQILDQVTTEWMAWLDSDDEWLPRHLEALLEVAEHTGAAFVFPWFEPVGSPDPLGHFGLPFNPATPHHTTITFLVRTELAKRVGFSDAYLTATPERRHGGEDWLHIVGMCAIAVEEHLPMVHLPERTWLWHIDGGNTSGVAGQGDAA
jgi:hypothetical protein